MQLDRFQAVTVGNAGLSWQYDTAIGKYNALMIVGRDVSKFDDVVTITLKHQGRVDVLCNRMPLSIFSEISNMKFGQSGNYSATRAFEFMMLKLKEYAIIDDVKEKSIAEYIFGACGLPTAKGLLIPLGSIYLDGEVELNVEIDWAAFGWRNEEAEIYGVKYFDAPAVALQYDVTGDLDDYCKNVSELYLISKKDNTIFGDWQAIDPAKWDVVNDCDIQLDIDGRTTRLFNAKSAMSATALLGNYENGPSGRVVRLFSEESALKSDIRVKVTGQDANLTNLLVVREIYNEKMISKNTIKEAEDLKVKIEKIERENPVEAKAKRHALGLPKSEDVAEVLDSVKESEA